MTTTTTQKCFNRQPDDTMNGNDNGRNGSCSNENHRDQNNNNNNDRNDDENNNEYIVIEMNYLEFYSGVGGWTMALEEAIQSLMMDTSMSLSSSSSLSKKKKLKIQYHCCAYMDHSDLCNQVYQYNHCHEDYINNENNKDKNHNNKKRQRRCRKNQQQQQLQHTDPLLLQVLVPSPTIIIDAVIQPRSAIHNHDSDKNNITLLHQTSTNSIAPTSSSLPPQPSQNHPSSSSSLNHHNHNKNKTKKVIHSIETLTIQQLMKYNANVWFLSPPCQPHTRQHTNQLHDTIDIRSNSFLHLCQLLRSIPKNNTSSGSSSSIFSTGSGSEGRVGYNCGSNGGLPSMIILENVIGFELSTSYTQHLLPVLQYHDYLIGQFILQPSQIQIPNDRPRFYCIALLPVHLNQQEQQQESPLSQILQQQIQQQPLSPKYVLDHTGTSTDIYNNTIPLDHYFSRIKTDILLDSTTTPSTDGDDTNKCQVSECNKMENSVVNHSYPIIIHTSIPELDVVEIDKIQNVPPIRNFMNVSNNKTTVVLDDDKNINNNNNNNNNDHHQYHDRISTDPITAQVGAKLNDDHADTDVILHITDDKIRQSSSWCWDIVNPLDTRSACFTSSYGKYSKGTGSILLYQMVPSKEDSTTNDNKVKDDDDNNNDKESMYSSIYQIQNPKDRVYDPHWADTLLVKCHSNYRLRYFTGLEISQLMGFPRRFQFPKDITMKQQWKLMGNSINVKIAAKLIELSIRVLLQDFISKK